MGKKDKRKVKGDKPKAKQAKFNAKKLSALAKRYWYWLVVIPLLIVAIILFCYFQGYFEPKRDVELITSAPFKIEIAVGGSYNFDVVASDGSEVTYEIMEGEEEIVRIEGNVVTAILPGETRIVARAAGKSKTFLIGSRQTVISWKIPVGGEYSNDVIKDFIYATFGIESYTISYDNTDVVNTKMIDGEEYFYGVGEGFTILEIYDESTMGTSFGCALIHIEVVDGLKAEDVKLDQKFVLNVDDVKIDYTDIYKVQDILIGEYFEIDEVKFDKAGKCYYYQRETDVIKLSQVGNGVGVKEGESIVTVFCIADDNTYVYANVKVRVRPLMINIQRHVGIEFATVDFETMHSDERIVYYEADTEYFDIFNSPSGYAESFIPKKEGRTIISGYNADGDRLIMFEVDIRPAEEYLGEEE